jgi:uncharacterized Tic20 family protein/DNA-binding XRE family transcriptional regulator
MPPECRPVFFGGETAISNFGMMIPPEVNIGERIRDHRTRKGLTQKELAEEAKIDVRTLQRIEQSQVMPRTYTLKAISGILGAEIIGREKGDGNWDKQAEKWIAAIHLCGLFILVFPPLIIWLAKKEQVKVLNMHIGGVMNFQLSMLIYTVASILLVPTGIGLLLLVLLSLYSTLIIVINTIRVSSGKAFRYPLSIRIIGFGGSS